MQVFHKKIVTDEKMHPVAVQIDYADWIKIEKIIELAKVKETKKSFDISEFSGVIKLNEDPVHFQRRIRDEWA